MAIPEWMRKIPHFNIGKCGGKNADCSEITEEEYQKLNWFQQAFARHDKDLRRAKVYADEAKRLRNEADKLLAFELRSGDKQELKFLDKLGLFKAKVIFR